MTNDEKLDAKGLATLLDHAVVITMTLREGLDMGPTDAATLVATFLENVANKSPPHPIDLDLRAIARVLRTDVRDE